MVLPADRQRDQVPLRGPAPLLHVPAPDLRPVHPGPGRADQPRRGRVRLQHRRPRPAPAVEGRDDRRLRLLAPSPASSPSERSSPTPSRFAPGEKLLVQMHPGKRDRASSTHDELQRSPSSAGSSRIGVDKLPSYDTALLTGGPTEGPEVPGYAHAGPSEPVKVDDHVLGGFGWQRDDMKLIQQMASNGAEPIGSLGYDGPLAALSARAPEHRRLLQGDRRRRHQPGDRPRARDRALLLPHRLRRAARSPTPPRRPRPTPSS